jgi:hypothetical protein
MSTRRGYIDPHSLVAIGTTHALDGVDGAGSWHRYAIGDYPFL